MVNVAEDRNTPMEPSDEALCRRAADGSREAEEALVRRYSGLVRSCARPLFLAGGDRLSVNSVGSFIRNYTVEGSKETELLRQGVKTKTGRSFTRFSIKSILQNPVYLIADKDAYQYFVDNEAELFSPESDFDDIPAQSQEKGQAILHKLK